MSYGNMNRSYRILACCTSLAKNLVLWPHVDAKEAGGGKDLVIVSNRAAAIFFFWIFKKDSAF